MESESESALARILIKQYLSSLDNEYNSHSSSDNILGWFKDMGKKLKANSRTALTHPDSVSLLCDLNNALADWQILKKKNKSIKRIFSRHDLEAQKKHREAIVYKLYKAEKLVADPPASKTESSQRVLESSQRVLESSQRVLKSSQRVLESSQRDLEWSQRDLESRQWDLESCQRDLESYQGDLKSSQRYLWDRYTFYKPHPFTCTGDEVPVSDEPKKWMADWLLTSDSDFKVVGIYGPSGSGKTALVKSVLKQEGVGDKFKCIIWACLSQLTSEEETQDVRIIEYLLYRLGFDSDLPVCNYIARKDEDWFSRLVRELESRLSNQGNYILVLDDMWQWFAVDFLGILKKIGGGAVIVTSRRKTVAEKIGENNILIYAKPRN